MNAMFGPKRPVQLNLDAALLERTEALGMSLATTVEAALVAHLSIEEAKLAEFRAECVDHARFTAAFIHKYGHWGEEFATI